MLRNQSFPLFYNFLPWQSHTQISTTDGPPNGDTLPCLRSSLLDRPRQQKKWVQMGFVLTRLQKLRQIMESTIHVSNKFGILLQHPSIKDFIYGSKYVFLRLQNILESVLLFERSRPLLLLVVTLTPPEAPKVSFRVSLRRGYT